MAQKTELVRISLEHYTILVELQARYLRTKKEKITLKEVAEKLIELGEEGFINVYDLW